MVSTFTTARNLEKPGRGDQVGTWDTAVNGNIDSIDAAIGQTTTISVSAGSATLSTAQSRCARITLSSALTADISVTFLTSFTGRYVINNLATGSSAFLITLQTLAGGESVGCPPGHFEIWNDGTNIKFHNFGPQIGGYWDYAGSSNPRWNTASIVPPYLPCDGTTFASSIYPQLAVILGSTTLPDLRGRVRAYLNQGTGRMTSGSGGVDGNTLGAAGGAQTTTLSSQNIPPVPVTVTDPGHAHGVDLSNVTGTGGNMARGTGTINTTNGTALSTTGITVTAGSTSPTAFTVMQPTCIGGITLIRAA